MNRSMQMKGSMWSGVAAAAVGVLGAGSADATLLITEIMYDPAGGNEFEYVEVYNNGSAAVDLTGYQFADNSTATTLTAGVNPQIAQN